MVLLKTENNEQWIVESKAGKADYSRLFCSGIHCVDHIYNYW